MGNFLVSVIIPVYNCEYYLAEAIESVLSQTYSPVELIVVDDGSTDGTAAVVRRFDQQIRYIYQANSGIGAARNQGAILSKGEFIAFLDADDIWVKEKLTIQMAAFDDNPELDIVFGHTRQFNSPELEQDSTSRIRPEVEIAPGFVAGTMLIKRKAFFQVGQFETKWHIGEFIDWYSKAMEEGLKSLLLSEVVMRRRVHTENLGIRDRKHRVDYVRVLKASLDRRRKIK